LIAGRFACEKQGEAPGIHFDRVQISGAEPMLTTDPLPALPDGVEAARDFLRIDTGEDDAVLARLLAAAVAQAEAFTASLLIARGVTEVVEGGAGWTALSAWPVTAITGVADVGGAALPIGSYEIDVDTTAIGKVRLTTAAPQRIRVTYVAGLATGWATLAEPMRQGIVMLVVHDYLARDRNDGDALPPDVAARWRGARRMRLS